MSEHGSIGKKENGNEQITVKQHFVQKAYLDLFSNNGMLYCYNINEKRDYSRKSKDVACVENYYESKDHEVNELEGKLAEIESECFPSVKKLVEGVALIDNDDILKIMRYASATSTRSPAFRSSCRDLYRMIKRDEDPSEDELDECARDRQVRSIQFTGTMIFGDPISNYCIVHTRYEEDILVTSDNPLVYCDLYRISKKKHDPAEEFWGFIYPLSPKVLLMIIKSGDAEKYKDEFCDAPGVIDPIMANMIMAETATELLFYKDSNNPIFKDIDKVERNRAALETYADLVAERKRSKRYPN